MIDNFLNIDFFRTLSSVIIGGLISLVAVLFIENLKTKKELIEKKRGIYNGLILTLNSLRRLEINTLQHGVAFRFHMSYYQFNNDQKTKEQAEYHQQNKDNGIAKEIEKSEQLDLYILDYKIYIGKDEKFDEIIKKFQDWPRPAPPNYSKIKNVTELSSRMKIDAQEITKFTTEYWNAEIANLTEHLSKKLL